MLLVAGCTPTPALIEMGPVDVNTLIDDQVNFLSQRKVGLSKEARVDGIFSDSTVMPTMEAWRAELAIFRQLGIVNKAIHQGTYRHEGPLDDPRSNLFIEQYSSTASPLKSLKIFYREDPSRIRKIEGRLSSTTILNTSERILTLEFDEENDKPVLTRYTVIGFQKVVLRDTVRFQLVSTIKW